MVYDGALEGRYVDLRSCTAEDAEFTLAIRQDPRYGRFIPRVDGTVDQQRAWIERQRLSGDDYFFVIWDKSGSRIGTIGLYNIEDDHCEAGRIIVQGNPFQSLEAQVLSFDFGFNILRMNRIISYIFADNESALRFSKQFGGSFDDVPVYRDGRAMLKKTNTVESFSTAREKLARILYRQKQ